MVIFVFLAAPLCAKTLTSGSSKRASIIYISHERPFFVIDRGTKTGFSEDLEACVMDPTGAKIICAPIVMARSKRAAVLVDLSYIPLLERGMTVLVGGQISDKQREDLAKNKELKEALEKSVGEDEPAIPFSPLPVSIEFGYLTGVLMPIKWRETELDATKELSRRGNYWKSDKEVKSSFLGAMISFQIPLSSKFSITPGLTYRSFSPLLIDTDGWATEPNSYITASTKATMYGGFLDFYWLAYAPNAWGLYFGPGFGYDVSTLKFSAEREESASSGECASATSKVSTMPFRLNAQLTYAFKAFSMGFAMHGLVPFGTSSSFSSHLDVLTSIESDRNIENDLKETLGHKAASFGVDAALFLAKML